MSLECSGLFCFGSPFRVLYPLYGLLSLFPYPRCRFLLRKAVLYLHLRPHILPLTHLFAHSRNTHLLAVGALTFAFPSYPFVGSSIFHKSRVMVAGAVLQYGFPDFPKSWPLLAGAVELYLHRVSIPCFSHPLPDRYLSRVVVSSPPVRCVVALVMERDTQCVVLTVVSSCGSTLLAWGPWIWKGHSRGGCGRLCSIPDQLFQKCLETFDFHV